MSSNEVRSKKLGEAEGKTKSDRPEGWEIGSRILNRVSLDDEAKRVYIRARNRKDPRGGLD